MFAGETTWLCAQDSAPEFHFRQRLAGLGEINVTGEVGETDGRADFPRLIKQRLRPTSNWLRVKSRPSGTPAAPLFCPATNPAPAIDIISA